MKPVTVMSVAPVAQLVKVYWALATAATAKAATAAKNFMLEIGRLGAGGEGEGEGEM